jgi:hypothetical protein
LEESGPTGTVGGWSVTVGLVGMGREAGAVSKRKEDEIMQRKVGFEPGILTSLFLLPSNSSLCIVYSIGTLYNYSGLFNLSS